MKLIRFPSASEKTATEAMPSSRQARMTRTALSPVGDQDLAEAVFTAAR